MKKTKRYGHSGRVGEAFEKIKNKFFFFFFFLGGGGGGGGGGRGVSGQGIERRSEAFVKFQKKKCWRGGGGGGGGRGGGQ